MLRTNVVLDDLLMSRGAALQRVLLALVSSALVFTGCMGSGSGPATGTGRDKMQTDERMGTREAGAKPAAVVELAPGDDIQKAMDRAEPGDTIALQDGVHYQNVVITRGGTPGKPVTLKAVHGGGATLSGAVPRDRANLKFERVEADLYKASVSNRVWWVMVGARNLVNYGQLDFLKKFEFPDQSDGKLNPCAPEGFAWQDGTLYIRLEKGADPNAEPVEISRLTDGEIDPDYGKPGHKGHWAPDSGFKVPGLGCLYSHSVGLINVKADNVVIEGFRLHMGVGAAVIVHGNDVTIRDCYITGAHMGICQPDSVELPQHKTPGQPPIKRGNRTGRGLTVEHCEFTAPPGYRLCQSEKWWGGLYGANISAVFMNYGGPRSVVRHNWVYDSAQDHLQPRGNGTTAPEAAGEIAYNFLQNCGDDSIEFDSSTPLNLRVHHNVIVDGFMCLMSLCPVMGGGLTIDHNLFYQSPENSPQGRPWLKLGSPWGWGLPTRGVRLIHNTVVQPHGCLRWFGDGDHYKDMLIENNIIYNGEAQAWDCFPISSNNLYCGPNVKAEHIPQVIHGEQPFVSLAPIDFNIRPDSAAVDAGVPGKDAEYFHKSAGKAPDLGAIELGETWDFPRPGPRWATGKEIAGRPALPASLKAKWVGLE